MTAPQFACDSDVRLQAEKVRWCVIEERYEVARAEALTLAAMCWKMAGAIIDQDTVDRAAADWRKGRWDRQRDAKTGRFEKDWENSLERRAHTDRKWRPAAECQPGPDTDGDAA